LKTIFQHCIGRSVAEREIVAFANFDIDGTPPPHDLTLLIGGMHGDEIATVLLLESFRDRFLNNEKLTSPIVLLPVANPDGYARHTRYNAHDVDLNRNCIWNWSAHSEEPPGPEPWSEPESRALRDFILKMEPAKIVSLHWALAEIDADGPQSTALAQAMWDALDDYERKPYRLRIAELGRGKRRLQRTYEICPGSLGQWCGYGLRYGDGMQPAMITLELPYDPAADSRPAPLPENHLADLHERWRADAGGYLAAVEIAVHKMLLAACDFRGFGGKGSVLR